MRGFARKVGKVVKSLRGAPARARARSFRSGKRMKRLNYNAPSRGGFRL